jgi:hypothetical protein
MVAFHQPGSFAGMKGANKQTTFKQLRDPELGLMKPIQIGPKRIVDLERD